MIRVTAFTTGRDVPSSRFRVRQHVEPLAQLGVVVREQVAPLSLALPLPGPLARLRRRHLLPLTLAWTGITAVQRSAVALVSGEADLTWIERHFLPGANGLVGLTRRPRVLDVDDAIWLEGWAGAGVGRLAQRVDAVVAGNRFLADWFSQWCGNVHVVPTAIDCRRIMPGPPPPGPLVIGWTGTSANYRYLERVAQPLEAFFAAHRDARFLVCADRPPDAATFRRLPMEFVRWSPAEEVAVLGRMHVGIMPLDEGDVARGKCSFKLLQYMAAAVPFVASPFGMNLELLAAGEGGLSAATPGEWRDAVECLAASATLRERMGAAGRALAESRFDTPVIAGKLAAVFRGLVGGPRRGVSA